MNYKNVPSIKARLDKKIMIVCKTPKVLTFFKNLIVYNVFRKCQYVY